MVSEARRSLRVCIGILNFVGIYATEKWRTLYKAYQIIVLISVSFGFAFGISAYVFFKVGNDLSKIADISYLWTQVFACGIKMFLAVSVESKIRIVFNRLEEPIFNSYNAQQREFIEEASKTVFRNSYLYVANCLFALFLWGVTPLLNHERTLPIGVWYFVDVDFKNTGIWVTYYLYTFWAMALECLVNACMATLVTGLLIQAIGQLKVLKDNLTNIRMLAINEYREKSIIPKWTENTGDNQILEIFVYQNVVDCIKHYEAIDRFVGEIQDAFSGCMFTQLMASCFVICISVFQLTLVHGYQIFAVAIYLSAVWFEVFLYCWYGTLLHEESNTIRDAIYLGEWYLSKKKVNFALQIFMERTKRPLIITAGKHFKLSMDTFTSILNTAYSFFAVLRKIQER